MIEIVKRLQPKSSVVKKLFAYSGNLCAMPKCKKRLVHKTGTMIGKIAHIKAAEKGGARFDSNMTNEQRRAIENLFIVCPECHDVIDDKENEKKYPTKKLARIKAKHEGRFKKAEIQFINQYSDHTQSSKPTYPTKLKRIQEVLSPTYEYCVGDDLAALKKFIDNLSLMPVDTRQFALSIAERMRLVGKENSLDVREVTEAFNISDRKLMDKMASLDRHNLGGINEGDYPVKHVVCLYDREPGLNPWIEIIEFCEKTEHNTDELILDLNFSLYG